MRAYIGTKIVQAEPEPRDGKEGYKVIYPDGYASWSPAATFEAAYREVSRHERTLLEQTDAEHEISKISDGEPGVTGPCDEYVLGRYSEYWDAHLCKTCGNLRTSHK